VGLFQISRSPSYRRAHAKGTIPRCALFSSLVRLGVRIPLPQDRKWCACGCLGRTAVRCRSWSNSWRIPNVLSAIGSLPREIFICSIPSHQEKRCRGVEAESWTRGRGVQQEDATLAALPQEWVGRRKTIRKGSVLVLIGQVGPLWTCPLRLNGNLVAGISSLESAGEVTFGQILKFLRYPFRGGFATARNTTAERHAMSSLHGNYAKNANYSVVLVTLMWCDDRLPRLPRCSQR
jgi:hypothetical protein